MIFAAFAFLNTTSNTARAQALEPVGLELVLAIDTSSSVDSVEFQLQMQGLADAFRHPAVIAAIKTAANQGIAVTVMQWSGNRMHLTSVDWTLLYDAKTAAGFASAIENSPRLLTGFTGLPGAIRFSLKMIEENRFDGQRKVINVSGDGSSSGLNPGLERDRAIARGATVNGLAILNEEPGLRDYYAKYVVGGKGAFLMTADDFEDFADAIRKKLVREIKGPNIARLRPAPTRVLVRGSRGS